MGPTGSSNLVVTYPLKINSLIALPHDYSEVINSTSGFTCPKSMTDEARVPAMCLVCGQVLCSQSYCCQVGMDERKLRESFKLRFISFPHYISSRIYVFTAFSVYNTNAPHCAARDFYVWITVDK